MEHDVEVVGHDPRGLTLSVDRSGKQSHVVLHPPVDLVVDRRHLPRVLPGANDEVVRVGDHRPHVEDHDVLGQLLLGEAGDPAGLFEGRQNAAEV